MEKIEALAEHLCISMANSEGPYLDDILLEQDDGLFIYDMPEYGPQEYLVLTDEEADQRATDYIRETLWAFNASFLLQYMPAAISACRSFEKAITHIQEHECEGCNEMLLGLVGPLIDELIEDAISADGRGHFMSSYDGEEREEGEYFIYRTN